MTGNDTEHAPDHCGADIAAYALGALEPAEADAMRLHLETCAVCPYELTSFQQVVDDLATSAPHQDAPRALKRRVMRAVSDEPRLNQMARRERHRLWPALSRPTLALGTGLALVVAAVLVVVSVSSGGASTRVVQAQVTGQGNAALRVSGGHAQLVVHHFPAPPSGKIYEVWLQRGTGAPQPTNELFSPTRNGNGDADVPGNLHGVSHVLVTPEPAGGSRVPTHQPVISAALT